MGTSVWPRSAYHRPRSEFEHGAVSGDRCAASRFLSAAHEQSGGKAPDLHAAGLRSTRGQHLSKLLRGQRHRPDEARSRCRPGARGTERHHARDRRRESIRLWPRQFGASGAAAGSSGRSHSNRALGAAGRRGAGAADRMRQPCEPAAGAGDSSDEGGHSSGRVGRRQTATGWPVPHREPPSISHRRRRGGAIRLAGHCRSCISRSQGASSLGRGTHGHDRSIVWSWRQPGYRAALRHRSRMASLTAGWPFLARPYARPSGERRSCSRVRARGWHWSLSEELPATHRRRRRVRPAPGPHAFAGAHSRRPLRVTRRYARLLPSNGREGSRRAGRSQRRDDQQCSAQPSRAPEASDRRTPQPSPIRRRPAPTSTGHPRITSAF